MAAGRCSYVGLVSDKPQSRGGIAGYLVEAYVPRRAASDVVALATAAEGGADAARRSGKAVRYIRSILVPRDETCFHVYEAASAADVHEAVKGAGIADARIVNAVQAEPVGGSTPTLAQRKEKEK